SFSRFQGSLNLPSGVASATITIDPIADNVPEDDETAILTLTRGTGYVISNFNSATGTILDDEGSTPPSGSIPSVSVAVSPSSVLEDGSANLEYTFTRTGSTGSALNGVGFDVDGSATFGGPNADYTQSGSNTFDGSEGTVNFAAGSATAVVTIASILDNDIEPDETLQLTVINGTGYTVGSPNIATGTIENDDFQTTTGSNSANIAIPDSSPANPYPSNITISGALGTITSVVVNITGLSHAFPDDIDMLLVGPTGANVILMSDTGTTNDLTNVNLIFDQSAASNLPDASQIVAGTYRPTNFVSGDTFAAPAPAGPYGSNLDSAFDGTNANGTWSLYVVDDLGGDTGAIANGWSLTIQTTI
ncbi:hypothetical protein GLO73106DRAFT_00041350, partial [Gloeocapsa sp. PCC 73106]